MTSRKQVHFLLQDDCYLYKQSVLDFFARVGLSNHYVDAREYLCLILACQLKDLDDF